MDMTKILERIDQLHKERGTNDAAMSKLAGSADLIRNWRRNVRNGKGSGANAQSIAALAGAFGVTTEWLISGQGAAPSTPAGFSEPKAGWSMPKGTPPDAQAAFLHILAPKAERPTTVNISHAAMAFALLVGDVAVIDLNAPVPAGALALITLFDGDHSDSYVARYLPPHFALGDPSGEVTAIDAGDPNLIVRGPILASFRPAKA